MRRGRTVPLCPLSSRYLVFKRVMMMIMMFMIMIMMTITMTMTMMMMRGRTVPLRPLSSRYLVFKRASHTIFFLCTHIYHRRCGAKDTQFAKWVRRRSLHPIRQVTRSNNEIRRAPQEEAKLTPPTFPARANFQITIPRNWKVTKVVSLSFHRVVVGGKSSCCVTITVEMMH